MSIMDLKKNAPKGEFLAYINKEEAAMLKKAGGSGKLVNGIPSFRPQDYGQEAASKKAGFDQSDTSNPYSNASQNKQAAENKAISDRHAQRQRDAIKAELAITPFNRNKPLSKFGLYNNQFQKKQNIKLAQKKYHQLAKKLENYVHGDIDMDYDFTQDIYGNKISKGLENLISNKGTSIEKTRPNLYSVNSNIPGTLGSLLNPAFNEIRPDTQVTLENTKNLMRDYRDLSVDPTISREKLEALANRGKLPEQIKPSSGGDNNQPFIPINYNTGAAEGPEYDGTNKFTYDENAFGPGGDSADVTRASYIFNKGGRVPAMEGGIMGTRARRAMGGIMNRVDQRQGYFLGKIVKGIKGAVSGVVDATKKVLKSDLGKMALLYGAGAMAGSYGSTGKFFSKGMFNPMNMGSGLMGLKTKYDKLGKLGKIATMGGIGLGLSMIPGLNKPKPNEDTYADRGGSLIDPITGQPAKPAEMRASLENALNTADGDPQKIAAIKAAYPFYGIDERLGSYVPYRNYSVANGGRIGYSLGNLVEGSSVVQPASGLAIKLNRPVKSGDPVGSYYPDPSKMKTASPMPSSGMGGMLSKLINNNPQLFKNVSGQNSNNYRFNTGENLAQVTRESYDFIDENMNGIDDREETIMANGGRIGFDNGNIVPPVEMPDPMERMLKNMTPEERAKFQMMLKINAARMPEYKPDPNAIPPVEMPTYPRTNRAEGGLMDLGGMEKDYRAEGGFVPIGEYEKKDDVPAD